MKSDDVQDKKMLIKKKADWAKNINEPRAAAEMYLSAGETLKAIEIIGENGWIDMLVDVGRKLDKADRPSLILCTEYLQQHKQIVYAAELYKRLGDLEALVVMYVENQLWDEVSLVLKILTHIFVY